MKHFLIKNSLVLSGAGGKPSAPPPPIVSQFPSVLAPPQFGDFNSINSFSYAEMIDLIADGPIEGLINKNGRKLYDENIFEGIYLNDTPIKETSSIETQYLPVPWLKDRLKLLWNREFNPNYSDLRVNRLAAIDAFTNTDKNFNSTILFEYFYPEDSVAKYISLVGGDINSSILIQRAFDSSPIKSEKPFLTVINIPSFKLFLDKTKFDDTEGGSTFSSPIQIGIPNISEHFYFSLGYDNLNLFNYFELPRSFVVNEISLPSGKKTFRKSKKANASFLEYEVSSINILIWSIFDVVLNKPKNFDTALDKYFTNLVFFQNKKSLFNFNLVSSEFRNGAELQTPLNGFLKTQMDIEIGKELIGPFKITNNFSPSSAFGAGGVQRLTSLALEANCPPPVNLALTQETSDDVRYIKNWPVEYTKAGDPLIIQNLKSNYAQFDRTSAARVCSEAVPIKHYISNQNVEEVYLTLNINQLNDTNHIDLVCSKFTDGTCRGADASKSYGGTKHLFSEETPAGVPSYAQLTSNTLINQSAVDSKYLLIFGNSVADGVILAGSCNITGLFNILCRLTAIETNARLCWDSEGVLSSTAYLNDPYLRELNATYSLTPAQKDYIRNSPPVFRLPLYTYNGSPLINEYMLPSDFCYLNRSLCTSSYISNPVAFESVIKAKDSNFGSLYDFSIDDSDKLSLSNYFKSYVMPAVPSTLKDFALIQKYKDNPDYLIPYINNKTKVDGTTTIVDYGTILENTYRYQRCTLLNSINNQSNNAVGKFFVATFDYFYLANRNENVRHIVSVSINNYINFDEIFYNWVSGYTHLENYALYPFNLKINKNSYPYITKFIINPLIEKGIVRPSAISERLYMYDSNYLSNPPVIGFIVLLGLNYDYLINRTSYWNGNFLKLDVLENLLSNFGHSFVQSPVSPLFTKASNLSLTNPLENSLKKIAGGGYLSNLNLYSFALYYKKSQIPIYLGDSLLIKNNFNIVDIEQRTTYDADFIYLYDSSKTLVSASNFDYSYSSMALAITSNYFKDIIIKTTLSSYELSNVNKPLLNNTVQYGKASQALATIDTTDTPADNIPKYFQQLTAGSKMPAVVSVKVETGYEGMEQQQSLNPDEYFAYQYDIYGLASEQSLVDIGRSNQDYVYSRKISSETGGFFSQLRHEYFSGLKLYLYKVTMVTNGVSRELFFLDDDLRRIGKNTYNLFQPNTLLGVTVLTGDSPVKNIGTRQTILNPASVSAGGLAAAKLEDYQANTDMWNDFFTFVEFKLTPDQVSSFFSNNFKTINLAQALSFLKQTINRKRLFPLNSQLSDSFAGAQPKSGNSEGFDRYEVFLDANNYTRVDLYKYEYTIHNIVDVSTGSVIPDITSEIADLDFFIKRDIYMTLYRERANDSFSFLEIGKRRFPEDVFYYLRKDNAVNIIVRFSASKEEFGTTLLDTLANDFNSIAGSTYLQMLDSFKVKF